MCYVHPFPVYYQQFGFRLAPAASHLPYPHLVRGVGQGKKKGPRMQSVQVTTQKSAYQRAVHIYMHTHIHEDFKPGTMYHAKK